MTKYGSFLTSLYGATGAVVGISLSLLLSSSGTPGILPPLIAFPAVSRKSICLNTNRRRLASSFFASSGIISFGALFSL